MRTSSLVSLTGLVASAHPQRRVATFANTSGEQDSAGSNTSAFGGAGTERGTIQSTTAARDGGNDGGTVS